MSVAALLMASSAMASGTPCEFAATAQIGSVQVRTFCDDGEFLDLPSDCAASVGNAWFTFTAPAAGTYTIDTQGSSFDTVLKVFSSCSNLSASLIACDDDGGGNATSLVKVKLTANQTIKIALGGYCDEVNRGEGQNPCDNCGAAVLTIQRGDDECCDPWDNGGYNGRGAQQSQVGIDLDWRLFGHVTFDDFWLCEGNEYQIQTVRGIICTNAVVPKCSVVITGDCDGNPAPIDLAFADSRQIDTTGFPLGAECRLGTVELRETGQSNADGLRIIEVTATFPRLWLRGGYYWVSFIGYSGNGNPLDEFYWGFAGDNGVVKGRPGKFYNSDDGSWTDSDSLCCGCTDFAFCVQGHKCKILLDNGVPDFRFERTNTPPMVGPNANVIPGSPSLQNGTRTSDKVRTADQFVVPPCTDYQLCYIQAWVISNCDRVKLDLFDGGCHCPSEAPCVASYESSCLTLMGYFGPPTSNTSLRLYKAEFYGFKFQLRAGHNYWVSAYGLGDNRQNARAYFMYNTVCDDPCPINFDPGCIKGAPYDTSHWVKTSPARDFAFLIGVEDASEMLPPVRTTACTADFNHQDGVTVQDLFDFLAAWFTGCP